MALDHAEIIALRNNSYKNRHFSLMFRVGLVPEPGFGNVSKMEWSNPDVISWDEKAREWQNRIGADGDLNRRVNSDPRLMHLAGNVRGLDILDAGCGTGYLAIKLALLGGKVRAVDFSPEMIQLARENVAQAKVPVRLDVDSISELATVESKSIDLIVSNYVLMDCADLDSAMHHFSRVLRPKGRAILVFSHPCFDRHPEEHAEGGPVYHWNLAYFKEHRETKVWGNFKTPFVYYHRPLSRYWAAFNARGFQVLDFEEPSCKPPYPPTMRPKDIHKLKTQPYSVLFHLKKG